MQILHDAGTFEVPHAPLRKWIQGKYWRHKVFYQRDAYGDKREELESGSWPRATRFIRILSTNASCRKIQTLINITSMYRRSSSSHRSRPTSKRPIEGM